MAICFDCFEMPNIDTCNGIDTDHGTSDGTKNDLNLLYVFSLWLAEECVNMIKEHKVLELIFWEKQLGVDIHSVHHRSALYLSILLTNTLQFLIRKCEMKSASFLRYFCFHDYSHSQHVSCSIHMR